MAILFLNFIHYWNKYTSRIRVIALKPYEQCKQHLCVILIFMTPLIRVEKCFPVYILCSLASLIVLNVHSLQIQTHCWKKDFINFTKTTLYGVTQYSCILLKIHTLKNVSMKVT